MKKDQCKPLVAVGVSGSCQIRHNMKTFGANGTNQIRCDQARASKHNGMRADECARTRESGMSSGRTGTQQARAGI